LAIVLDHDVRSSECCLIVYSLHYLQWLLPLSPYRKAPPFFLILRGSLPFPLFPNRQASICGFPLFRSSHDTSSFPAFSCFSRFLGTGSLPSLPYNPCSSSWLSGLRAHVVSSRFVLILTVPTFSPPLLCKLFSLVEPFFFPSLRRVLLLRGPARVVVFFCGGLYFFMFFFCLICPGGLFLFSSKRGRPSFTLPRDYLHSGNIFPLAEGASLAISK